MRKRRNKRGEAEGQYIPLPYSVLHHPAWRSLSGSAVKVYLELRSRYNGVNNGKLCLSMDDAADLLGIGKATAQRAFDELTRKGFIVKMKQGHWYGRKATEWRVTDKSCDGHLPTRDWLNWRAGEVVKFNPRYRSGTYRRAHDSV